MIGTFHSLVTLIAYDTNIGTGSAGFNCCSHIHAVRASPCRIWLTGGGKLGQLNGSGRHVYLFVDLPICSDAQFCGLEPDEECSAHGRMIDSSSSRSLGGPTPPANSLNGFEQSWVSRATFLSPFNAILGQRVGFAAARAPGCCQRLSCCQLEIIER